MQKVEKRPIKINKIERWNQTIDDLKRLNKTWPKQRYQKDKLDRGRENMKSKKKPSRHEIWGWFKKEVTHNNYCRMWK